MIILGDFYPIGPANSVLFSASHGNFMNAVGGAFGVLPLPKNEENLSSPKKLKNQKKRKDRSRVNGSRRKKTKADSTTDLVLSNEDAGNGKPSASKSRKRTFCAGKRAFLLPPLYYRFRASSFRRLHLLAFVGNCTFIFSRVHSNIYNQISFFDPYFINLLFWLRMQGNYVEMRFLS